MTVKQPTAQPRIFTENIARINEALRSHESIYLKLLLVCAFGLATINSFSDLDMIVNNGHQSSLPLLNVPLSPKAFLWLMPLIITIMYIYYILLTEQCDKLYRKAGNIAEPSNIFDYTYTCMGDSYMQYCNDLHDNQGSDVDDKSGITRTLLTLKTMTYWFLLFAIQPATQLAISMISLRKHDFWLTSFQLLCTGPAFYFSVFVLCRTIFPLHGRYIEARSPSFLKKIQFTILGAVLTFSIGTILTSRLASDDTWFARFMIILFTILASTCLYFMSGRFIALAKYGPVKAGSVMASITCSLLLVLFIFSSSNPMIERITLNEHDNQWPLSERIPFSSPLSYFNYNPFLDLRNAIISTQPNNWTGEIKDEETQIKSVKGADLQETDLRGADIERAFLARANLRGADLRGAYLRGANLSFADLRKAKLENAYIRLVNFRNADLREVDFGQAVFVEDINDPTYLRGADFQGARFDWRKIKNQQNLFPTRLIKTFVIGKPNQSSYQSKQKEFIDENRSFYTKNLPLSFFGFETKADFESFAFEPESVGRKLKDLGFPGLTDAELRIKHLNIVTFPNSFSLEHANFDSFRLNCVTFNDVFLQNASFRNATLKDVDFTSSDLTNADFTGADLSNTKFNKAILTGTIFKDCKNLNSNNFPHNYFSEKPSSSTKADSNHGQSQMINSGN